MFFKVLLSVSVTQLGQLGMLSTRPYPLQDSSHSNGCSESISHVLEENSEDSDDEADLSYDVGIGHSSKDYSGIEASVFQIAEVLVKLR